jgi:hypothetical protein
MDLIIPLPQTAGGNAGLFVVVENLVSSFVLLLRPRMSTPPVSPDYFTLTSIAIKDFLFK